MTKISSPALRYHGGKFRIAPWIITHMPPHDIYVEPFGGAAGVLLQKTRSHGEIYNDLDGEVVNFFRIIRNPDTRKQLIELLAFTPYARSEFELAYMSTECPLESARRLVVRAQMAYGSAGATKSTTGFRIDTKRKYGTSQQLWAEYPEKLAIIGQRFQGVLIENRPAIQVMQKHDKSDTLHFVDPPYLTSTRVLNHGKGYYNHEMTDADHIELLEALKSLKGMVILSGYRSELYKQHLTGWGIRTKPSRASAYRGTKMAEEIIWLNPACIDSLRQSAASQSI